MYLDSDTEDILKDYEQVLFSFHCGLQCNCQNLGLLYMSEGITIYCIFRNVIVLGRRNYVARVRPVTSVQNRRAYKEM